MPALNAERFIAAAIRSLLRESSRVDLDIIVIDDGSSDSTWEITAGIAAQGPQVRALRNPGKGIAAARNTGLRNIRSDCAFVTFHDADDISHPGRIERQRARLVSDPSIHGLYGMVEMFTVLDDATSAPAAGTPTRIIRGPYLQSAMFRLGVLQSVGDFDESYRQGCDSDFFLRVIDGGFQIVLEDEVAAYYRRHDSNVTLNVEEMKREFMRASLKWAARNRLSKKAPLPPIFSDMFLRRAELEEGQAP